MLLLLFLNKELLVVLPNKRRLQGLCCREFRSWAYLIREGYKVYALDSLGVGQI